jgi:hypothetical protein
MRELTEQDLQRVYDETFAREVARGTTFVVAEGRALVARLKASAGVAGSAPGDSGISPEDALGPILPAPPPEVTDEVFERVLAEQLQAGATASIARARACVASVKAARKTSPRPPTPVKPRAPEPSAPQAERPAEPEPSGARGEAPRPPQGPVADESPDQTYERVLAEQTQAGASEAVAVARAKAARVRALRGIQAPATASATPASEGPPAAKASASASAPPGPVEGENPEAAYERVLAEQREAGASEAVAVARAKVARVKAQRALGN